MEYKQIGQDYHYSLKLRLRFMLGYRVNPIKRHAAIHGPIKRAILPIKQSKAKQRCVMGIGMCLYAQLVQTKNT